MWDNDAALVNSYEINQLQSNGLQVLL
jgi:hypothetical protein